MKYDVTITGIGDFSLQLLQLRESMIIFDKDVPYEYLEMVISHTKSDIKGNISVGDIVVIADKEYKITAIGSEALKTLKEHGHCTLIFNGAGSVEQPGQIALAGRGIPRVMVGDKITLE